MINKDELESFAITAQSEIDRGTVEDALRSLLEARLYRIFEDSPWWIQEHVLSTETHLRFAKEDGSERRGFADSVVGKTAIEYEKNLENQSIFDEGYHQVKEYCAALCNLGINENEILGILSDTVRWYGYAIRVDANDNHNRLLGANDIELIEEDCVDLSNFTDATADKFCLFVNKYLSREQSRLLTAKSLEVSFGFNSEFYHNEFEGYKNQVEMAMRDNPTYAALIRDVWQSFVAYLGASEYGEFSIDTYTNELYLVTVAKLICANILNGAPLVSNELEIISILNGGYFKKKNIQNLVDYDYFGWLNSSPYVDGFVDYAINIQRRLTSYDYTFIAEEDLFGLLLAQLSNKDHRLLLGQEFTPHWIARSMVEYTIDGIGDEPRMLDMCCGSGVFLIETIKKTREKFSVSAQDYDSDKDRIVFSCVMGFDIDPLAVVLSKVNWIMTMRDLFPHHNGQIVIPVYHADSLFVATPITNSIPEDLQESVVLRFDNQTIELPGYLLTPEHRQTFEAFMSKCYGYAMIRAKQKKSSLTYENIDLLVSSIENECGIILESAERKSQSVAAYNLVLQLEILQRQGRNGIWYFILNNSYKPGLVANQFNCIISNPPWLAMSKLANNPYKETLHNKTSDFGINPPGAAHLHMELATTFLLASIERYLKDDARWLCVMPGTILNGYHHNPLRLEKYRNARSPVKTVIDTIWELPANSFKNKAVVLGGVRSDRETNYPLDGRLYQEPYVFDQCSYSLITQGGRSAWSCVEENNTDILNVVNATPWEFRQGADVMPRTAWFHLFTQQPNGTWSINRILNDSELYYLINDRKEDSCLELEATGFSNNYIYDCLISKHLSPFFVSTPAKTIIPGTRVNDEWHALTDDQMACMNAGTTCVFQSIQDDIGTPINKMFNRVNTDRNKITIQVFSHARWLVLSSAGGANPCAAYIDLEAYDKERLVIDQTLYWYIAETEDEAIFITGMLNSQSLNDAIADFQPEGGFGRRHIHTIPYSIIPRFDACNDAHIEVVARTRAVISEWSDFCRNTDLGLYLSPNRHLSSRRHKLHIALVRLNSYEEYEAACSCVLCVDQSI